MSPYATVSIAQYGDPLARYVGDKQGHVTKNSYIYIVESDFVMEYLFNVSSLMS
jgi:hypothetical protein